jgi:hypothetical protein
MSTEPEASLLEEALRSDLPSKSQEDRLRKRLLSAGILVGPGLLAGSAAASTTTAQAGFVGATAAKLVTSSWLAKLGVASGVTVSTLALASWVAEPSSSSAPHRPGSDSVGTVPYTAARPRTVHNAPPVELLPPTPPPSAQSKAPLPSSSFVARAENAMSDSDSQRAAPASAAPSVAAFDASENAGATPALPSAVTQAPSTLAAETGLLDGAFAAIRANKPEEAWQRVREHERRFPSGLLEQERERARARLIEMSRGN